MLASVVFLLVSGFVFFLSLVVLGILQRAFERYKERYVVKSKPNFFNTNIPVGGTVQFGFNANKAVGGTTDLLNLTLNGTAV